jgi:potassium efflux system protein
MRQQSQELTVQGLRRQQQEYVDQVAELTSRLERERDRLSPMEHRLIVVKIRVAGEMIQLIQLDVRLASIVNDLNRLEELAARRDVTAKELKAGSKRLRELRRELSDAEELLQGKVDLVKQQLLVIERRDGLTAAERRLSDEELRAVQDLLDAMLSRAGKVEQKRAVVAALDTLLDQGYEKRVRRELFLREQLPTAAEEWQKLLDAVMSVPGVLLTQVLLSVEAAVTAIIDSHALHWVVLAILELAVIWSVIAARRGLKRVTDRLGERGDTTFITTAAFTVLRLLRRNLLGFGLAATMLVVVFLFKVPQPGLGIIVTLVLIWVGIKTPINLAWLLLASPRIPIEQRRPALYRQVSWTLFAGGILGAMCILVHLSQLSREITWIFDSLFMFFLVLAFLPVLRVRRLIVDLLAERYADRFWFISLRLITLMMPLTMLVAAAVGLMGYINLAWVVAWHLLLFVLVLIGWQIVRALVNDLVVLLKNYAVMHSGYALLWTQDVINPLHRILDVGIFLGMIWGLSLLYNLDTESFIVAKLIAILEQPLFTLGQASISLETILFMIVVVMMVFWFGQWGRSITFRWVFSRIGDLGVRHSLSVFTQYFIVLIGFLIMLNMLGLDLTTLAVFAGALGVGIGLGMQDMAKNFISGLLLLIERPLRAGDTVQIGTQVGEVTHIGIRSLTVKTWDNMEVIIPNSDVISNAFTNWTHTDNLVRTVLMIGARYDADPHQVKRVISRVLENHPNVLGDPEWLVLFWEFGESAITFRVQYFTDFFKANILEVHDEVLFGIWDGFKGAGIGIPYPQRDLHIKEWPSSLSVLRKKEPGASDPPLLRKDTVRSQAALPTRAVPGHDSHR